MKTNIDTIRNTIHKAFISTWAKTYEATQSPTDGSSWAEIVFRAGYLAALSTIDPEAKREEVIEAFRMDELDAVMLSVDKWSKEGDPRLKLNPATRAADAREIALRAIEKNDSDAIRREVKEEYRSILETVVDQTKRECDTSVQDALTKCGVHKDAGIRKAISAAILGTEPAREMPKCTRPNDTECHAHSGDKCYNHFQCEPAREGL